jgi:hypothetical protein
MWATYNRLNIHVHSSVFAMLREAYKVIAVSSRGKSHREARHSFYRDMIGHHCDHKQLVTDFNL